MSKAFEVIDSPLQQALREMQRKLNQSRIFDATRTLRQQDSAMWEAIRAAQLQTQHAPRLLEAARALQQQNSAMQEAVRTIQAQMQHMPWLKTIRELQAQDSPMMQAVRAYLEQMQKSSLARLLAETGDWQPDALLHSTPAEPLTAKDLQASPLIRYLVSDDSQVQAEPPIASMQDGLATADLYEAEVISPDRQLDQAIVEELRSGTATGSLTPEYKNRLFQVLCGLWFFWDFMLRVSASIEAYEELVNRLALDSKPAHVRQIAEEALSDQHKELLAGMRIVTRHNVILRTGPGAGFNELSRLPIATPLELLSEPDGAWLQVYATVNDEVLEGWVYRAYTTAIPEPRRQQ